MSIQNRHATQEKKISGHLNETSHAENNKHIQMGFVSIAIRELQFQITRGRHPIPIRVTNVKAQKT